MVQVNGTCSMALQLWRIKYSHILQQPLGKTSIVPCNIWIKKSYDEMRNKEEGISKYVIWHETGMIGSFKPIRNPGSLYYISNHTSVQAVSLFLLVNCCNIQKKRTFNIESWYRHPLTLIVEPAVCHSIPEAKHICNAHSRSLEMCIFKCNSVTAVTPEATEKFFA